MVPVPRRAVAGVLGPARRGHLQRRRARRTTTQPTVPCAEQDRAQHPEDLDDGDAAGVAQRRTPGRGVLAGHPQPQRDHREPHDHVADDDEPEVVLLAGRAATPAASDEHAGHHHEGEQPEDDVVGVVGAREPRVVHPGPPDREEDHRVAGKAGQVAVRRGRGAASRPPRRHATTKHRSKNSSSGVDARCASSGSRPAIGRCHGTRGRPPLMAAQELAGRATEHALEHLLGLRPAPAACPAGCEVSRTVTTSRSLTAAMRGGVGPVDRAAAGAGVVGALGGEAGLLLELRACRWRGTGCRARSSAETSSSSCSQVTTARTSACARRGSGASRRRSGCRWCRVLEFVIRPALRSSRARGAQVGRHLGLASASSGSGSGCRSRRSAGGSPATTARPSAAGCRPGHRSPPSRLRAVDGPHSTTGEGRCGDTRAAKAPARTGQAAARDLRAAPRSSVAAISEAPSRWKLDEHDRAGR